MSTIRVILLVAGFIGATAFYATNNVWAQQHYQYSYSAAPASSRYVQRHNIDVGDLPHHEIAIYEIQRTYTSDQPMLIGLKVLETWAYGSVDQINGVGTSEGYSMWVLEDGSKVFSEFHGTVYGELTNTGFRRGTIPRNVPFRRRNGKVCGHSRNANGGRRVLHRSKDWLQPACESRRVLVRELNLSVDYPVRPTAHWTTLPWQQCKAVRRAGAVPVTFPCRRCRCGASRLCCTEDASTAIDGRTGTARGGRTDSGAQAALRVLPAARFQSGVAKRRSAGAAARTRGGKFRSRPRSIRLSCGGTAQDARRRMDRSRGCCRSRPSLE